MPTCPGSLDSPRQMGRGAAGFYRIWALVAREWSGQSLHAYSCYGFVNESNEVHFGFVSSSLRQHYVICFDRLIALLGVSRNGSTLE